MEPTLLLSLVAAGCLGYFAYYAVATFVVAGDRKISSRLNDRGRTQQVTLADAPQRDTRSGLKKFGMMLAKPFMPEKDSTKIGGIRKKLAMAGIYDPQAIKSFVGFRFISLIGGVVFGYVVASTFGYGVLGLALGGLLGYMIPNVWMSSKISANQKALNVGLPDALDLMVICVESGLTIDASMQRVGEELSLSHPALSREFSIAHMETRVGVSRQESFKNLATRTSNTAIQSLTAMLIQSDRFGTGVGTALRVQAEAMRSKRQFQAEELAAKASVKMSFPLVLFVFPATFIVLAGPTVIGLLSSPLFTE
jgi:tight adherence protein C